jgi:thiamine biosynthesis lipoprotein
VSRPLARATFAAMSTTMAIVGVGVPEAAAARAADRGQRLAADWERRFSRFRPDSQLSGLNAAGGRPFPVDDVFLDLLEGARAAVRRTGGRFDPSILPALEAAGYDRSIEGVGATPVQLGRPPRSGVGREGWEQVRIDHGRGEVTLPPEMRIDLGGVAKGAFADRLAMELAAWPGGCVDAGGDLRLWGLPPDGDRWAIGIEDPFHPDRDCFVAEVPAASAGVATSGTYRRRWQAGDRTAHHLIDPRRGVPVADVVCAVTAIAPDTATADVAAKALLLAAADGDCSDLFGATIAVIVYSDGQTTVVSEEYVDGPSRSLAISIPGSA